MKLALDPLAVTARGTASLVDLAVADGDRPILTVGRLETAGLDYTSPARVAVDRLRVEKSWARIERTADGAFTLRTLFGRRPVAPGAGGAPVQRCGRAPPRRHRCRSPSPSARARSKAARRSSTGPSTRPRGSRSTACAWASATSPGPRAGPPRGSARAHAGERGAHRPRPARPRGLDPGHGPPRGPHRRGPGSRSALPAIPGSPRGKATADLGVKIALDPLAITAGGTASLADLSVADGDRVLLTASRLEATGVDYRWPATVAIDRLRAQKAWALIERAAGGGLSVQAVLSPPVATSTAALRRKPASGPAAPAAPPLDLRVRRSVIEDGAVTFVDAAVSPGTRVEITGARLAVRDLAWPVRGLTGIRLRAPMPAGGTLEANGQARLDGSSLDLRVLLNGVDLAPARPYLGRPWTVAGKADADLGIKGRLDPLALSLSGQARPHRDRPGRRPAAARDGQAPGSVRSQCGLATPGGGRARHRPAALVPRRAGRRRPAPPAVAGDPGDAGSGHDEGERRPSRSDALGRDGGARRGGHGPGR